MLHPLFAQIRILYYFLTGWIVTAALQGLVIQQLASLSLLSAGIDTLVYNSILLSLSLSLWYPLRYADKKQNTIIQLLNNSVIFIVYLAIWLMASWGLASNLLENDTPYIEFANRIIWFRALWGAIILLLISVLYHSFDFYSDLEEKKQQHEQMERLLKETELKALKTQLNPHFLFNSLNSISSLTLTDPAGARDMINKLSDFLRYSLRNKDHTMLMLSEEMQNMNKYLDIEKIRFGERLVTETEADERVLNLKVPAMILQPLYENAVKHGVYESTEPVHIRTTCTFQNDLLEITITNNYDGDATSAQGEGLGLENIRQRMKLLYKSAGLLTTVRENNYFKATLTIPQTLPA